MKTGRRPALWAFLYGLVARIARRKRGDRQLTEASSSYNDIKDIESLVGTFKRLVSKLSREGNELGELYVTAEKKAARYALLSETVIESVTSGILVVGRRGEVGLMNSSARRLLGVADRDAAGPVRLSSLFGEARELESLVDKSFKTGRNSARNSVPIRTLDGVSRTIGASISCLGSETGVDAIIVVFTELVDGPAPARAPVADEKAEVERESYLRGGLDSYDLLSSLMGGADRIEAFTDPDRVDYEQLAEFVRDVRHRCDLMMVFALSKRGSSSLTELVDINGMVESILRRKEFWGSPALITNLTPGLPRVKTVGKVLEMGLEMLLQGCIEESAKGIEVKTGLWRDRGVDVAGVMIGERGPTRPIVEIGDSLRDLAADKRLRREAGLLLLKSLPSDSHRIGVEKKGSSFLFSAGVLMPIQGEAGPSRQSGDISDRGQDEG
jgi:PAS domain-containing protein